MPGQVYNVCDVAVKNGTSQTFTASNNFTVRMTNQPRSFGGFPVLTGNEQWKPGQILVFYVLTKKYYPVSFVAGGFQFNLGGRSSTAVPGPAGIFLRLKYNPATFAKTLNWIVAYGQGNEVGKGADLWSAQHVNQRDHRRENPAKRFRRAFLGTDPARRGRELRPFGGNPERDPQLWPSSRSARGNRSSSESLHSSSTSASRKADKTSNVLSGLRGCAAGSDQEGRGRSRVRWIESADSRSSS